MIDLSYLKEISGGDNSFIKEMLELYVTTTAAEADLFSDLYQNNDLEGIGHLAHKMKAPIQMLGATDLFNAIRLLEKYGKDRSNLAEIPGLIDLVKQQISDSITEIEEIKTTLE